VSGGGGLARDTVISRSPVANEARIIRAVPQARWMAKKQGIDLSLVKGSGPNAVILPKDIEGLKRIQGVAEATLSRRRRLVSSLAGRLAEKRGIPLERIKGTGNRGRILMADVMRVIEKTTIPSEGNVMFGRTQPMRQMRKVIAKRMSQSALTAPHIYFFTDVEMDVLDALRQKILPHFEKKFGIRISMNDFFIKAAALTIREFPILNAMLRDEEICIMPEINIGLAVAVEEGLIVPAIPRADELGLGEIAQMRTDLVDRARARKLKLEEIERGTFTISSLAQFDITFFTAILNPPQSGILTTGKATDQLALREGKVISKKIARFGLSVDHRIIDGVMAAKFLQSLKNRLERPAFASA
jgi:pyruvate dehydrogenase E2 component (dihydrolipoamide acetyltransferase)